MPLAADEAFRPRPQPGRVRANCGPVSALPERYLVFAGRYDARKDLGTLFSALAGLRASAP